MQQREFWLLRLVVVNISVFLLDHMYIRANTPPPPFFTVIFVLFQESGILFSSLLNVEVSLALIVIILGTKMNFGFIRMGQLVLRILFSYCS